MTKLEAAAIVILTALIAIAGSVGITAVVVMLAWNQFSDRLGVAPIGFWDAALAVAAIVVVGCAVRAGLGRSA